jgi:high-affinity K+ transport system ATPase subunit B
LVVSVGAALTTLSALLHPAVFTWDISAWLWLTVVFANLAEAVAESRGKAQAESLRKARTDTVALRLPNRRYGTNVGTARAEAVAATELKPLDFVVVEAGEMIPADGDVVDGVAAVDESAITGESAPVIRESGGDRSGVTGGTTVLSERIVVRVSARPGHSFLDRMIALVEDASGQKTPNEIALNMLLAARPELTPPFVRHEPSAAGAQPHRRAPPRPRTSRAAQGPLYAMTLGVRPRRPSPTREPVLPHTVQCRTIASLPPLLDARPPSARPFLTQA